jgi:hypothetical protein
MELALLVNSQEHGTQEQINVCLNNANKTNIGMLIPTNAHGVLMKLQSGMVISALHVQLALSTSRIDTFV